VSVFSGTRGAWDCGIETRLRRTVEPTDLPVTVAYLRDNLLRVCNGTAEDTEIEAWGWAAVRDAEGFGRFGLPQRAISPQTWELMLSGFPWSGRIVLPIAPVIGVSSVAYYDSAGDAQELAVSPQEFALLPSGQYAAAEIRPLAGACFPATACRPDAVTVTFTAGYLDESSPALQHVLAGIGLFVGELYRQRTLSVLGTTVVPATLRLERFWSGPF
jgi:uncharacterized phiE125 gp8 family phage protein